MGIAAACFPIVRIQTVATSIKSMDNNSIFAVKTTAKAIPAAQIQLTRKRPPARPKENQRGAINFQLTQEEEREHPCRRSQKPFKPRSEAMEANESGRGTREAVRPRKRKRKS